MSDGTADRQLRERARAVIPGGMYGHQAAPGAAYPQFMRGGRGARVWDVDGNEYVDLMCSYGPVVLGHQHPAVEAAARAAGRNRRLHERAGPGHGGPGRAPRADRAARGLGDTSPRTAPTPPPCAARSPGRRPGGARSWWRRAPTTAPRRGARRARPASRPPTTPTSATTPSTTWPACSRPPPRRAMTWPASWSARSSTTPASTRSSSTPLFARGLRELCDATGAALILDDVRAGFRLHLGLQLGAGRGGPGPVGLEQGDRERPGARRRARQRRVPRRREERLRHRLVLVLRRARWRPPSPPSER